MPQHAVRRQADLAIVIEADKGAHSIDAQADHQHDPAQHRGYHLVAIFAGRVVVQLQGWHSMLALPGDERQAVKPQSDPCRQRRLRMITKCVSIISIANVVCTAWMQAAPADASWHRMPSQHHMQHGSKHLRCNVALAHFCLTSQVRLQSFSGLPCSCCAGTLPQQRHTLLRMLTAIQAAGIARNPPAVQIRLDVCCDAGSSRLQRCLPTPQPCNLRRPLRPPKAAAWTLTRVQRQQMSRS